MTKSERISKTMTESKTKLNKSENLKIKRNHKI